MLLMHATNNREDVKEHLRATSSRWRASSVIERMEFPGTRDLEIAIEPKSESRSGKTRLSSWRSSRWKTRPRRSRRIRNPVRPSREWASFISSTKVDILRRTSKVDANRRPQVHSRAARRAGSRRTTRTRSRPGRRPSSRVSSLSSSPMSGGAGNTFEFEGRRRRRAEGIIPGVEKVTGRPASRLLKVPGSTAASMTSTYRCLAFELAVRAAFRQGRGRQGGSAWLEPINVQVTQMPGGLHRSVMVISARPARGGRRQRNAVVVNHVMVPLAEHVWLNA